MHSNAVQLHYNGAATQLTLHSAMNLLASLCVSMLKFSAEASCCPLRSQRLLHRPRNALWEVCCQLRSCFLFNLPKSEASLSDHQGNQNFQRQATQTDNGRPLPTNKK
jgi:hypothetical protein